MTVDPAVLGRLVEALSVRNVATRRRRLEKRLARHLAGWWAVQARSFIGHLAEHRSLFAESISEGEWGPAWDATRADTDPLIVGILDDHAAATFGDGVVTTIVGLQVELDFDLDNPRAAAFLKDRGANLVTRIDATTRDRLRTLLVTSVDEGWSWQRTGREINQMFAGFSGRGPMGRHLRNRAELVAVTETAEAHAAGNHAVIDQLAAQGVAVQVRWRTVGDNRVSAGCARNGAAGWQDHGTPFPSGHLREPRFPGCRCVTVSRVAPKES